MVPVRIASLGNLRRVSDWLLHRQAPAIYRTATSSSTVAASSATMASPPTQQMDGLLLAAKPDMYSGMIVDDTQLPTDVQRFTAMLEHSLQAWRSQGMRGIWLRVPLSHVALVAPAVQVGGFQPHHAEKDYIMLVRWLPDSPSTLPLAPSHQVGVGALVVNEHKEVLMVMERSGPLKGRKVWKMPTGLTSPDEDVTVAAEREVLEETGIRAHFECVLAIRQAHGFAFGKSDFFIVVGLKPEPGQDKVVPQESELEDARWMPLDEYMAQPFMQGVELYDKLRDRCYAYAMGKYHGFKAAKMEAGFLRKRSDLLVWGEDDVTPTATASAASSQAGQGKADQEQGARL